MKLSNDSVHIKPEVDEVKPKKVETKESCGTQAEGKVNGGEEENRNSGIYIQVGFPMNINQEYMVLAFRQINHLSGEKVMKYDFLRQNKRNNFYYAHSKIKSFDNIKDKQFADKFKDISGEYSEKESLFEPLKVNSKNEIDNGPDGWLRNVDTEAKMLEDLARRLGDKNLSKGSIKLFTELPPCPSCSRVIKLFNEKYPNIVVEVIHNNGVKLK